MSENSHSSTSRRYAIVLAILVCAFLLQYFYPGHDQQVINYSGSAAAGNDANEGPVKLVTDYLKCGHSVVTEDNIDAERLKEILAANPDLEQQRINGIRVVKLTNEGLCPDDAQKRYLGIQGEYLAVFKGIVDRGELERITQIKVNRLPAEWQQQLIEGKLVFEDEVALLEALDSLDEYQL